MGWQRRLSGSVGMACCLLLGSALTAAGTSGTFTGSVDASGTSFRGHTISVEQAGTIRAVLDWGTSGANLNLMLFDPSGVVVTGAYSTSKRPETITYEAAVDGTWRLGVKAKSGSSAYSLSVEYPGPVTSGLSAVDRAADAGIAQITKSWGTYVHDFDGDGDDDFLFNRSYGSPMLAYANDGSGHFSVRPDMSFAVNDRHHCAWGSIDQNESADFYCAVGASGGKRIKSNELWLQRADGTFASISGAWGATDPYGRGRDPALFDANNDGLVDLFVGNYYPRVDGLPTPNRYYLQSPAGDFRSAPGFGVDLEIGGQCAEPADFDGDGFIDLAVCAHGAGGGLKLYRNNEGTTFTNVSSAKGITGQWCDLMWVDLNSDGRPDLTMMNNTSFQIMLQRADGTFGLVYKRSMENAGCRFGGNSQRIASGDVNDDGASDLYLVYSGYADGGYNLPDVFLVNDGTGTRFRLASLPQTTLGSGSSVAAVEADGDGETEFLVTNGRATLKGPIQLIDFLV
jgi:hypothetical protein